MSAAPPLARDFRAHDRPSYARTYVERDGFVSRPLEGELFEVIG